MAAASTYQVPVPLITSVLEVEGGKVGAYSTNTNGSYDLGPMQINTIWLGTLAEKMGVEEDRIVARLIYDPCFNIGVGTWILSTHIQDTGNFWQGVARYHSRTPHIGQRYAMRVYDTLQRQLQQAGQTVEQARAQGQVRD